MQTGTRRSGPLADEPDETLHARVLQRDTRAFRTLVLRHEARLRAFATRMAGPTLAEDIAQEVFFRAWTRAADWRREGSYAAWLAGIAWRLFLDHERKERRRRQSAGIEELGQGDFVETQPGAQLDIDRLLAPLSPIERAAIILCDGHGWSQTEASAILAIPLGTFKSAALRAKDRIRQSITRSERP